MSLCRANHVIFHSRCQPVEDHVIVSPALSPLSLVSSHRFPSSEEIGECVIEAHLAEYG